LKPGGDGRGPEGDEESGDGGRQREQHAFGQQLLREPAPGWLSGRTVWKARWHGPRSAVRAIDRFATLVQACCPIPVGA
jgi:hypothetical protein